jgi:RNA polymerase sigma-B factor
VAKRAAKPARAAPDGHFFKLRGSSPQGNQIALWKGVGAMSLRSATSREDSSQGESVGAVGSSRSNGAARHRARPSLNGGGLHAFPGNRDEALLLRRFAQTRDPRLKAELTDRFLPLARSLALRYRGASEQLDDLIQVASLGLIKALDGFDERRGTSFIAYAAPTILGELRRHFRDRVWEVRLPRGLQERSMAVSEAAQELADQHGRTPTVAQIATRLELPEEEVSEALQADEARRTLSLDQPRVRADEDASPLVETVGGSEPGYDAVEAQMAAADAPLDERERTVLRLRFDEDLNQYEIGRRVGVSQMQVSRIMRRALRKLLEAVQGGPTTNARRE